jgi:hypothetical protein
MQYIKLLELRGVTELEKGQSIQKAINLSGGAPTLKELANTNEQVFLYWMAKHDKLKDEVSALKEIILNNERTISRLEKDGFKLQCFENAGVDNWQGYDFAMEAYWEVYNEDD